MVRIGDCSCIMAGISNGIIRLRLSPFICKPEVANKFRILDIAHYTLPSSCGYRSCYLECLTFHFTKSLHSIRDRTIESVWRPIIHGMAIGISNLAGLGLAIVYGRNNKLLRRRHVIAGPLSMGTYGAPRSYNQLSITGLRH